jgi:chorismate mutase
MKKTAGLTLWDHKRNEEILRNLRKLNQFLNLFRIIGQTGRNILKDSILAESQTTF